MKRQFAEDDWKCQMETSGVNLEQVIVHNDSDAGDENDLKKPKKIKLKKPQKPKQIYEDNNPNVLGFESSSSEEEEEEETESEENQSETEIEDKENVVEDEKNSKAEEEEIIISKDNSTNNLVKKVEKSPTKEETIAEKKTIFVPVSRTPQVVEARSKLPIIDIEHDIVDKIRHNDVVIITGETGSGKTTQGNIS